MVTLSPMTVALVCRVGDPLQLTCTALALSIRWSILRVIDEQGTLAEVTNSVIIDGRDNNQMKQGVVNSTTFTFTRSSASRASPLNSTVSIDSVSIGLNGTVVRCTDVANPITSASTMVKIVDISQISKLANYCIGINP